MRHAFNRLSRRSGAPAFVALAAMGVVAAVAAVPAGATFPGRNGPIAFRQFDPATGQLALYRALPDGSQVTELTDRPGFFSDWRPDGRRLAFDFFDAEGNEQIATMTADGGDLREITSGPGIHEVPSWSPDGRDIVFDFSAEPDPNVPGFHTRLWTMRADGSHARPLPIRPSGFDIEPRYSPDGRWIAFGRLLISADGEQQQAVFIVRAHGGPVRQLTPFELNAEHPTWSPDSRLITFDAPVTFDRPESSIQVIRPDGRARRTILPVAEGFGGHKPWFSPDGSRILFMCATTDLDAGVPIELPDALLDGHYNEDICVMNADGTRIANLTDSPNTLENWPSWGPAPADDPKQDQPAAIDTTSGG
jgi:Tol biopolymer transport system component